MTELIRINEMCWLLFLISPQPFEGTWTFSFTTHIKNSLREPSSSSWTLVLLTSIQFTRTQVCGWTWNLLKNVSPFNAWPLTSKQCQPLFCDIWTILEVYLKIGWVARLSVLHTHRYIVKITDAGIEGIEDIGGIPSIHLGGIGIVSMPDTLALAYSYSQFFSARSSLRHYVSVFTFSLGPTPVSRQSPMITTIVPMKATYAAILRLQGLPAFAERHVYYPI